MFTPTHMVFCMQHQRGILFIINVYMFLYKKYRHRQHYEIIVRRPPTINILLICGRVLEIHNTKCTCHPQSSSSYNNPSLNFLSFLYIWRSNRSAENAILINNNMALEHILFLPLMRWRHTFITIYNYQEYLYFSFRKLYTCLRSGAFFLKSKAWWPIQN